MKKIGLSALAVLFALLMLVPFEAFAQDVSTADTNGQTADVIFSESIALVKGKGEYINVKNVGGASSVKFTSSNAKVAAVNSKGRITAKECGVADITVEMTKGELKYSANIHVSVEICKNKITKEYGSETKADNKNTAAPALKLSKELCIKDSSKISVKNADSVKYTSSNSKIATVDENGKITAKKAGKATITIAAVKGSDTIKYYEIIHVVSSNMKSSITTKERNKFYSTSAFVGSSIGVGQQMYFNSKGKGYLGNPLMLVRGCYSFNNDKSSGNSQYKVRYKGTPMKAKYAIKKSGVDKVFISMGTNDMGKPAKSVYKDYVSYISGIRKENPNVVIFIESTTAVHPSRQGKYLNSKQIATMNSMMEDYCKKQKDMYFVDVSSRMLDKNGNLLSSCCSDSYVHLTFKGYSLWMEDLTAYTDKLMIEQQNAKDAVTTAVKSKNSAQYKKAKKLVDALESSTFKSNLKKELQKAK